MNWIVLRAVNGDGSENWYRGEATPRVRAAVKALNGRWHGIAAIDPWDEDEGEQQQPPSDGSGVCLEPIADEQKLIDTLVWWCNNCPDEGDYYEFVPVV